MGVGGVGCADLVGRVLADAVVEDALCACGAAAVMQW
jgi:hypothetical protein